MRTLGCPEISTVARAKAAGSLTSFNLASSSQALNRGIGVVSLPNTELKPYELGILPMHQSLQSEIW